MDLDPTSIRWNETLPFMHPSRILGSSNESTRSSWRWTLQLWIRLQNFKRSVRRLKNKLLYMSFASGACWLTSLMRRPLSGSELSFTNQTSFVWKKLLCRVSALLVLKEIRTYGLGVSNSLQDDLKGRRIPSSRNFIVQPHHVEGW